MRVRVLGPIHLEGGDSVAPLGPQACRLIGVLVARSGEPLSAGRIADELGGGEPGLGRMAVSRLRKVLGDRIVSGADGYRLSLADGDWLDAGAFEELLGAARAASTPTQRRDLLREALGLWRGAAFAGLDDVPAVRSVATRLDELRSTATEDLAETLLELGRAEEAVLLLEDHRDSLRYRERPVALMMRALATAGRVTEALRGISVSESSCVRRSGSNRRGPSRPGGRAARRHLGRTGVSRLDGEFPRDAFERGAGRGSDAAASVAVGHVDVPVQ